MDANDIAIVSEGKQFRKWLKENNYTLKQLSDKLGYSILTLNKYIKPKIECNKFKGRLLNELGINLDNIIVSQEDQIINIIIKIIDGFRSYHPGDIRVLERLLQITKGYKLYYQLMSKILIAHHYASSNIYKQSHYILNEVGLHAIENNFNDLLVYVEAERTFIHLISNDNKKALETCNDFSESVVFKQFNDKITSGIRRKIGYLFYYRYGVSLIRNNSYAGARRKLKQAISLTDTPTLIYINMALSYKRENKLNIAVEYFNKALDVCKNKIDVATIYNNLANTYFKGGNIKDAKVYITKSIGLIDDNFHICETYNYIDSYLQIYEYEKDCIDFYRIINWTKEINRCTNYFHSQLFLFAVIKYCILNEYMVQLEQVFDVFKEQVENEKDKEVAEKLMVLGYKAFCFKTKMEGKL
ncbi:helix-turn-helix transcriptional regulator [Vallitalea pronyensis]|uniref:Helix-turn-helix transcriptional regulator n=1 Tax=Vallitalea pronyensis TaxID=1348613 RepID=A0A8J8MNT4_9FIRM|nr:helix-turn-helix transcriptional regulator [Vallitalea pronyensis]QUI24859.1 helix-turn-helix transcriptional regulator [Vallitalea pronyensis]